jgi:NAD+ synthase
MTKGRSREPAVPAWTVPPETAAAEAERFVAEQVARAGADGVLVGLSGGVDSAVAAALAVRGLGSPRVRAVLLPHRTSHPDSLAHARAVAAMLGVATELVEITPLVDAWSEMQPGADALRRGNVMARARMLLLYDLSQRDRRLVLGTGNRSEWLLGYTTLHGDNACAFNPLGGLYKTEIRLLAAHLGLPEEVRSKPPSADLWHGQTDEDELGFTYAEADRLLHHLVDERLGERQLAALGFPPELVERVRARLRAMAFKRLPTPVLSFPGRRDPDGTAP